jgi:hypothetical protein
MTINFYLTVQNHAGLEHEIQYQLADNPIAVEWFKKLKHIYRIPLDQIYTTTNDIESKDDVINTISEELELINSSIGKIYNIKDEYNQFDCNFLHSFTINNQYNYNTEIRNMFHRLHRKIHLLEFILSNSKYNEYFLPAEWGEKSGLLTTQHEQSPYQYYTLNLLAGNIYQFWSEFGKTPLQYWKDQDSYDIDHFIKNCRPHMTFRPGFSLCIKNVTINAFNVEFDVWFTAYRKAWQEKYNADKMSEYSEGGILLATPIGNQFDYPTVRVIKSIRI